MSDLFLTAEELVELTGYRHADRQKAVLRENGIPFTLDCRQRPVVARAWIENGGKTVQSKPEKPAWQPAALRQPRKAEKWEENPASI